MATEVNDFETSSTAEVHNSPISTTRSTQRMAGLHTAVRWAGAALFFIFVASAILLSLPKRRPHYSITHEFGIGFDLSPSYATVAVSCPNGSVYPIARVEGNKAYKQMMLRLSLASSQHLHQPYQNVGDALSDSGRRTFRNARKKLGLPASTDVGTLSHMIQALTHQASLFVCEPVSAAAISIPHLAGLYAEDTQDAFEYLSLVYLEFFPYSNFRPIPSSIAAYAGNGLGLCHDYRDVESCEAEEGRVPALFALTVSYTHTSLITSQAHLSNAYYIEETPTFENMRLGYDKRHTEGYWDDVRDFIEAPVVTSPMQRVISMVLVFGDAAKQTEFREVLRDALQSVAPNEWVVVDQQPEFSPAMGVAEFAKRAIFKQRKGMSAVFDL